MAYGEVKLKALGDVSAGVYEDPDKLARSGRGGGEGNYEQTAPYEFPVSKPDQEAPLYHCTH